MRKIIATVIKEWVLMRRDISGLLMLLVMPAALIIVMALIQDAPFRDYQELKFDLLLTDNDGGSLSRQIAEGLKQSKNFHIIDSIDHAPLTEDRLKQLLNKGDYKIGIVIPKGITAEIVNSANIVVNDISLKAGLPVTQRTREIRDQVYVQIFFDPVSKPAFRSAISSALDKYITYSCSNLLMQRLSLLNKNGADTANDNSGEDHLRKIMQGIGIREEPLTNKGTYTTHINSVQHNVPAWAIFGMFFIVIPVAGHIIKERQDGSAVRIALIPNVIQYVAMGRIIFYTLICTLQFLLMLCIGFWIIPLFNLPPLYPGLHAWLLLPVAVCIGFTATTYGYFIGSAFSTFNQALSFSSLSIVILSAIGGIWVPVEILPRTIQRMSLVSPLHWSLDAVDQVILRNGGIGSLILPLTILILTGAGLWAASVLIESINNKHSP